jgi:histone acetyltransferase (RNA polymerase elongator complex component)
MNPLIIPIFLPNLGCRQRCIFCNQKAVAPEVLSPSRVREFIDASMNQFPLKKLRERQVAFYGGSFTAIPKADQIAYLTEVRPFLSSDAIDSIRVSTSPCLDEEILCSKNMRSSIVELGPIDDR